MIPPIWCKMRCAVGAHHQVMSGGGGGCLEGKKGSLFEIEKRGAGWKSPSGPPLLRRVQAKRENGFAGPLALYALLQPGEHPRALQSADEQNGNDGPPQTGDAKGEDVGKQGRFLGHDEGGHWIGGQRTQ